MERYGNIVKTFMIFCLIFTVAFVWVDELIAGYNPPSPSGSGVSASAGGKVVEKKDEEDGQEEDEEESATEKCGKELISQFTTFINDVTAMQGMSDKEKIDYILTKGEERIREKTWDTAQEIIEQKAKDYAKKMIRAEIFKSKMPKLMHDVIVERKSVDSVWSAYDVQIKSELDTKMAAVGSALEAAKTLYKIWGEIEEGNVSEAFESLRDKIAEKIVEYYIPGWGWWQLGKDFTIAICEYIKGYAFNEALQAKRKFYLQGYDPVKDPEGFKEWILNEDIEKFVNDKWWNEDTLGSPGEMYFKGKENEGDQMRLALIADLKKLKDEILEKEKLRQQLETRLRQVIDEQQSAQKALIEQSHKVYGNAQPVVDAIKAYSARVYDYKKEDARRKVEEYRDKYEGILKEADPNRRDFFRPLEHGPILSALTAALEDIYDAGFRDGYDTELMTEKYESYKKIRENSLAAFEEANKNSLREWLIDDINLLKSEEKLILVEAQGRMARKLAELREGLASLNQKGKEAYNECASALKAADDEARTIHYTEILDNPSFYDSLYNALGLSDSYSYDEIGGVVEHLHSLEAARSFLNHDRQTLAKVYSLKKKALEEYVKVVENIEDDYENLVPKSLRDIYETESGLWNDVEYKLGISEKFRDKVPFGSSLPDTRGIPPIYLKRPGGVNNKTLTEMLAEFKEAPLADLDKLIAEVDAKIRGMGDMVYADELLFVMEVRQARICNESRVMLDIATRSLDEEKKLVRDSFVSPEENAAFLSTIPEETKGFAYLAALKEAWTRYKDEVEKTLSYRKHIGNLVRYKHNYKKNLYDVLANWETIPERIKLYEEAFNSVKKVYEERVGLAEKYLNDAKERFKKISKEYFISDRVEQYKKLDRNARNYIPLYENSKDIRLKEITKGWLQLTEDIAKEIQKVEEDLKKYEEATKREEEERKKREEEERKKKEKEDAARAAGFTLMDVRLNTYAINNASGDVVIIRDDLKNNALEITAKVNPMDRVEKLLISEDGGTTWKELPKQSRISYSFIPIAGKRYKPMLKVIATYGEEFTFELFPNVNSIMYDDKNYKDLVAQTIKKIAEAYETQNLSLFSEYIARDFLGNKTFLEEGVRFDFDMFNNIRLTIFINRTEKRGSMFAADTRWEKTQVPRMTGQQQRTTGNTTFYFALEEGKMKIKNLRGNLIYATLSPEIAESSGLSQTVVDEIRTAHNERTPVQPGAASTPETGGVSLGETISIKRGTVTAMSSFDLEAGVEIAGLAAGDLSLIPMGPNHVIQPTSPAGFQETTQSFDSITTAPTTGYATAGVFPTFSGTVLLFKTHNGYYGKMEVTESGAFTVTFRYAVQSNGSTNIRTQ